MRDYNDRAFVVLDVLLHPLDGGQVQVVGRLVEHEKSGLLQQQLGQHHAHPPAARKLSQRLSKVVCREAKTFQNRLRLRLNGVAVQRLELVLSAGQFVHKFVAVVGFHLVKHLVDLGLQFVLPLESLHGHRQDGFIALVGKQVLVQEADGAVAGLGNAAFVGLVLAVDQA